MDDRGIVIFMVDEKMSPAVGKQLLKVAKQCRFFFFQIQICCIQTLQALLVLFLAPVASKCLAVQPEEATNVDARIFHTLFAAVN